MDIGADLYDRYLSGDDSAIEEMVILYRDGLILFLNGIVRDIHVSEDLTEDTFVKIVTRKPHFSRRASFKSWLYTIARNLALDHLRKNAHISTMPIEEYTELSSEELSFIEQCIREDNKRAVHSAIRKLNAEYHQVLYLVYFEELSNTEAAAVMKKSKRQMENLLYRARKALRTQLEREGFIYEDI